MLRSTQVFILFILPSVLSAQVPESVSNYFELINKAELSTLSHRFAASDSFFINAFKLVPRPFSEDFFLAAQNAVMMKKNGTAADYLVRAVKTGLTLDRIRTMTTFTAFRKSAEWKILKSEYNIHRSEYLNSISLEIQREITKMIKKDQQIRGIKGWFYSRNKADKVDEENFGKLKTIIAKHGWPGFNLIGENNPKGRYDVTGNITLMLLHFSNSQIQYLKPFLFRAINEMDIYPHQVARILDYTYIKETGRMCQLYGTYTIKDKVLPIDNIGELQIRRKQLGLEPLDDYLKKRGYTLGNDIN